jgi:hypothetical protein
MASDANTKPSRSEEDQLPSMLGIIREKLRPILLHRWKLSRANALKVTEHGGMTERERSLYMAGFQNGWISGAQDIHAVKPSDLQAPRQDPDQDPDSGVH